MPARSKSQQRLFGMIHAIQKGDVKPSKFSKKIRDLANRIDPDEVRHFAATKTENLPEKKASFYEDMFVRGFLSRILYS